MSTTSLEQYLSDLGRSHGFSLEELAVNRKGQLHPAQQARLRPSPGTRAFVLAFVSLLVLGGGLTGAYFYYDDLQVSAEYGSGSISAVDMNGFYAIVGGTLLLSLLLDFAAIRSFVGAKRKRQHFDRGVVEVLEGPVKKLRIRHRQAGTEHRYEIAGRSFWTRGDGWELVTAGANYRIYCVGNELVSIEPA